jgi:uncharacterized protein YndB with AHSA1/START domain
MDAGRSESTSTADREIVTTRVFDAPRALVWKVWTEPEHAPHWWGPAGFRTTTQQMEVRPGGQWRYTMHGPDGHDYPNLITYQEVRAPEFLRYKHGGEVDLEPVNFDVTVTFEELGRRTRVTMRALFPSSKARDFVVREYNAVEGGKQHLARLSGYLAQQGAPLERPFVISRAFPAPRELVFRVWTEREHLVRWFGPQGCTIPAGTLDLRPGGTFHYCMRFENARELWGKWVFREIVAPERLVFVSSFSDPAGGTARHEMHAGWPLEMLSTVTFEEHAGISRGTVVTVSWSALDASAAERKVFDEGRASMQQGWSGTFDRLAEHLAQA